MQLNVALTAVLICAGCHDRRHSLGKKLNGFKLARLAMVDGLTTWERSFVRDVSQRRKLSPKQQQIIDRLCTDYLKTEVAS